MPSKSTKSKVTKEVQDIVNPVQKQEEIKDDKELPIISSVEEPIPSTSSANKEPDIVEQKIIETEESTEKGEESIIETTQVDTVELSTNKESRKEVEASSETKEIVKPLIETTVVGNEKDVTKEESSNVKVVSCDNKSDVLLSESNVLPSAPLLDQPVHRIVTYPQLPKYETTLQVKIEKAKVVQEKIKPFTESQLEALYTNQELVASKQFIFQFIDSELRGDSYKQHPLYELLVNYLRAKDKLKENTLELNQLKSEYKSCQNQLWLIENVTISNKAACQDGTYVTASHEYKVAKFQKNSLESLVRTQNKIKRLANEVHTLHSYTTSILKLKVS